MTSPGHILPTPKQARSALSTSRLLDAAAELIAEGGYDRMTLAAIGERAGYSHGLVSGRFGSKEGLLWALIDRMVNDWRESLLLPAVGDTTGAEALHTMLNALHDSWQRIPARMRALSGLMFEALLPVPILHHHVAQLHRELRRSVQDTVEGGIADGSVGEATDAAAVSRLLVGALRGAVYQALLDPEGLAIKQALADVHTLVDVLLPHPDPKR